MARVLLAVAALAVGMASGGHDGPSAWRQRRAIEDRGSPRHVAATAAGQDMQDLLQDHVQRHLQQLASLSRAHLEAWYPGQQPSPQSQSWSLPRQQPSPQPQPWPGPQSPSQPRPHSASLPGPQAPSQPRPQPASQPRPQPRPQSWSQSRPPPARHPPPTSMAAAPSSQPSALPHEKPPASPGGNVAKPEPPGGSNATTPPPTPSGPSQCVFAIVSCCRPAASSEVRYACFELLGCEGAFWDASPCEPDSLRASLLQVAKFYRRPAASSPRPATSTRPADEEDDAD